MGQNVNMLTGPWLMLSCSPNKISNICGVLNMKQIFQSLSPFPKSEAFNVFFSLSSDKSPKILLDITKSTYMFPKDTMISLLPLMCGYKIVFQ